MAMLLDLVYLLESRIPVPRDSVTDVVVSSITTGIFAGNVELSDAAHMSREEKVEAFAELSGGFQVVHNVLSDTVELLATWRHKGVSQQAMKRALLTRSLQLGNGLGFFVRKPEKDASGPSSFHGGWRDR